MEKFTLSEKFINKFKRKKPPFGFNGLGELVYMRTYSRIKEDGKNENEIIEVFEKGYLYKDRVIRHAKVVVNQTPS